MASLYKKALVNFTDEEGYGKYLDLNETFQKYINLKGIDRNELVYFSILDISSSGHII